MRRTVVVKSLGALLVAAALASAAAAPAQADPVLPPAAQDIVGTGADAANALMDQFSADYNATVTGTGPHLYSWNAYGPGPITTKAGAPVNARPGGSDQGISLLASTTSATVDFASSSRGQLPSDPATLKFVAFGKDAVTWAAQAGGHAPANLTTQDLYDIYSCAPGKTNWASFGGTSGTIKPYLPQLGSGTRSVFLKAIGSPTPGLCVTTGPQESEGTDPALNDPDVLIPYSVGHWVGQSRGHTTATDDKGGLTLRNINGVAPLTAAGAINAAFANPTYGRLLYNVVRAAEWNASPATTQSTALRAVFGPAGYLCSTPGKATTTAYGFLTLPASACGV
ncbi:MULTISPECIES: substrate-binding domain-containing protein [Kitasatospora]|uniref:PBP domain-containing protein n=1 Tax=Kitasatospora setae (strain ATCC 33774 / DSM 43861 / JCM 3304 / KCC A-0304 / NBRC 14216 / KM-6054) TaxID=452652 RepID=E4N0Z6_KITSK|nr:MULTISPECIES: substrate-binding domain-containing protein [Kitasatospora]BAJ31830.1 hypothetical protein KSE_60640 [Kitasatospora setae KM-6054]